MAAEEEIEAAKRNRRLKRLMGGLWGTPLLGGAMAVMGANLRSAKRDGKEDVGRWEQVFVHASSDWLLR